MYYVCNGIDLLLSACSSASFVGVAMENGEGGCFRFYFVFFFHGSELIFGFVFGGDPSFGIKAVSWWSIGHSNH